jgi:hypothetical protein
VKVHYVKNHGSKNLICSAKPGTAGTTTHIKKNVTCKVCNLMLGHERKMLRIIAILRRENAILAAQVNTKYPND